MTDMTPEGFLSLAREEFYANRAAGDVWPSEIDVCALNAIRAAVQAEREACATIADACANQNRNAEISAARQGDAMAEDVMREVKHEAEAIAAAIRARGEEEG